MPAINQLPDAQARVLLNAYQGAVAVRRRKIWLGFAIVAGLYALSVHVADVRPATFIAHIDNFTSYLARIQPTLTLNHLFGDIRDWYWNFGKWLLLLGDTLLVAYLGTLLGALGAFVLCFMACANLTRNWILRALVRRWLEFCRTVPDIVFAMIFLIAFKSGPMAGALALTVHTMGALGKLYAEVVENIDMKPVEGTTATGGSWLEVIALCSPTASPADFCLLHTAAFRDQCAQRQRDGLYRGRRYRAGIHRRHPQFLLHRRQRHAGDDHRHGVCHRSGDREAALSSWWQCGIAMNKSHPDEPMHDFALADLPGLMARHPVYFRPSWLQRAKIGFLLLAMAALAVFAMIRLDFTPDRFFNGVFRLGNFVLQMLPPNADGKFWFFVSALAETLAIAFLGTLTAALFAAPASFLAARNVIPTFLPISPYDAGSISSALSMR